MAKKTKPTVFLASVDRGLHKERKAFDELLKRYEKKFSYTGFEQWASGEGPPKRKGPLEAEKADFLFLVLGGRYGTISETSGKGITELEYERFLYTHTKECVEQRPPRIYVFQKKEEKIHPEDADPVGTDSHTRLLHFISRVRNKHVVKEFGSWQELQAEVGTILQKLPDKVDKSGYRKVSIKEFDFKIFDLGPWLYDKVETAWSNCPCSVHSAGGCDFKNKLYYRPPSELRLAMEELLQKRLNNPDVNEGFKVKNPSFKTTSIQKTGNRLRLQFCHSTWHMFWCTNQGAGCNSRIDKLLTYQKENNWDIRLSPFSNNLGLTVAVVDRENELVWCPFRDPETVTIAPGKRGAGVGTQLHGDWEKHKFPDGSPNIFGAVYNELKNEPGLKKCDITGDIRLVAWGVGTRTGTPELLFICNSTKALSEIRKAINEGKTPHHKEFDKTKLQSDICILHDYEVLADMLQNREKWEPESAVANCLAIRQWAEEAVDI